VKVVRASDCRTTAWKNGGGSTTEIAVQPAGASLDDFDWRVSMARVPPMNRSPNLPASIARLRSSREADYR
jgi:environmental stress-induced protein Ves